MGECSRVHLTTCRARLGGAHSIASLLHNEQGQRELTTRGIKRQARETQYMYQVRDQNSAGILLARQPREEGNKEDKENPGHQTKVNGHLNMDTAAYFNYWCRHPENPQPKESKETSTRWELIHSHSWLSRAGLTPLKASRLITHKEEMNMRFQQ